MTEDREAVTKADETKVICPNCNHQFRAISIADQAALAQSDAEPRDVREAVAEMGEWLDLGSKPGCTPNLVPMATAYRIWRAYEEKRRALTQSDAEPVAWRYAYPGYPGHWNVTSDKLTVDERQDNAGCIIEPLYTTTPRPNASAGLIEAADEIARIAVTKIVNSNSPTKFFRFEELLAEIQEVLRARAAERKCEVKHG